VKAADVIVPTGGGRRQAPGLPACALGPDVDSAPNRNEFRESSEYKGRPACKANITPPSVSPLCRKCGSLDVSRPVPAPRNASLALQGPERVKVDIREKCKFSYANVIENADIHCEI
jgi:hypothetical protein